MTDEPVAPESRYDPDTVTNCRPQITPRLLKWWESLNQQQKVWYCEIHPVSDLTLGHLGQQIFDGWDAAQMRDYHAQQANDLKLCLMGAIELDAKEKLVELYHLQLWLAAQ